MDPRLPPKMWTPSTCLSNAYPDAHFTWVEASPGADRSLAERLGLDLAGLCEYKEAATGLFEEGALGWPHIFLQPEAARRFAAEWLSGVQELRLIRLMLPADHLPGVIADTRQSEGQGETGVHRALSSPLAINEPGNVVGFEPLGLEWGGTFHSFVCNGLEVDLMDELGFSLNEFGLLSTLKEAEEATAYINRDETGAEPVPWHPWRIDEVPIAVAT